MLSVGTSQGLHRSDDGGETFKKSTDRLVETSRILWAEFDQNNVQKLYLGLSWGALMSEDGGETFKLIFVHPWPSMSYVRVVKPDPIRRGWIWLGTYDGLMLSQDSGETFERVGGLLFVGQKISRIVFGATPGRMYVSMGSALWTSSDAGENWSYVEYGDKTWWIEAMEADGNRPDGLFIVTEHEILRYGPKETISLVPNGVRRFREKLAFEPKMGAVVARGLVLAGLDRATLMKYRQAARDTDLLPSLHFVAKAGRFETNGAFLNPAIDEQRSLENRFVEASPPSGVFLKWNLQELTFSTEVITSCGKNEFES